MEPTPQELHALAALMYDSGLFQAHPITVTAIRAGVEGLLTILGRPDLAVAWDDQEKLATYLPLP